VLEIEADKNFRKFVKVLLNNIGYYLYPKTNNIGYSIMKFVDSND